MGATSELEPEGMAVLVYWSRQQWAGSVVMRRWWGAVIVQQISGFTILILDFQRYF
jgi:hypothetical protein